MSRPLSAAFVALFLVACGNPEIRIGKEQGIPSLNGSETFTLGAYTCGMPISSSGFTVTTRVVGTDCEFSFDQDVELIKASDYQTIGGLEGSANLVQAVELEVKALSFTDTDKNMALSLTDYVKEASLKVDGQQVADKSTLSKLPTTVRLEGAALNGLKAKIDARQPASVHATAILLVPQTPAPPAHLKVDYDAQPTLIVGAGKINLGQ